MSECSYLLVIVQPDGELQVDSFLPEDNDARIETGSAMMSAIIEHFQNAGDSDHTHNGHREVPISGVDV